MTSYVQVVQVHIPTIRYICDMSDFMLLTKVIFVSKNKLLPKRGEKCDQQIKQKDIFSHTLLFTSLGITAFLDASSINGILVQNYFICFLLPQPGAILPREEVRSLMQSKVSSLHTNGSSDVPTFVINILNKMPVIATMKSITRAKLSPYR